MQGGKAVPLFIAAELKHFNSYSALVSILYYKGDGKYLPVQYIQLSYRGRHVS